MLQDVPTKPIESGNSDSLKTNKQMKTKQKENVYVFSISHS